MSYNTTSRIGSVLGALSLLALSTAGLCAGAQAHKSHARITAAQARATALKKYPGHVEGKVKLENEDGSWQYSVMIRSGKTLREVMVDAHTGKIASVEKTSKAEEQREAQQEKAAHKAPPKTK